MTFQPGNKCGKGRKDKPWRDALVMALKRAELGNAIHLIADRCVADALAGDKDARREIAERMDGKVPQAIAGDDGSDPVRLLQRIERVIVDPRHQDGESVQAASSADEKKS